MPRKYHRMPPLPKVIDDTKVSEFMSHYYATSNDKTDHEGFADMFTKGGEYSINSQKAKGRDEIINMRKAIWSHIPDRDHVPLQIYTHGHDEMQLMSRGKVSYKHHYGHETETEWAAYYDLAEENGEIKLKKCHIIADTVGQV